MKKPKRRSKLLDIAKQMPPLPHTLPDEPFDIFKSKALGWLISQPDILNYLWEQIRQSGYVTYDSENGEWHGIERM